MVEETVPVLLVTANVGSVFEDPSRLLKMWIHEFLHKITIQRPQFVALHLQEVGGKTYEKSMEYVQEFIKILCESNELENYNRIRVFLDEDYTSAEHFTALGNLYFIEKSIKTIKIWNFLTHEWDSVDGKCIHTGNIEAVATKEKSKFPQHFFPECKWSRKGFLRTRWEICGTVFDMINIHLFHDASNLAACEEFPSVYCKSRRRALVHTLEKIHSDHINGTAPYFLFGDFNFRCDTAGVIKKLTEDLTTHRIQHVKTDYTKVHYRNCDGCNVLTVGKKEFTHIDHQTKFKESWLQQFDRELEPLKEVLVEYPITFPPSYPFEEEPSLPKNYMFTRCPAWCDRILISPSAKNLIYDDNFSTSDYNIIGEDVCMGDHKPVYLNVSLKLYQGTLRCNCEHVKFMQQHNLNVNDAYFLNYPLNIDKPITLSNNNNFAISVNCLYTNHNFCNILLECIKFNKTLPLSSLSNNINLIDNSLITKLTTMTNTITTTTSNTSTTTTTTTLTTTTTTLINTNTMPTTTATIISNYTNNNNNDNDNKNSNSINNNNYNNDNNNNNNNIKTHIITTSTTSPSNTSSITSKEYIKPIISINVTDTENLNICLCSLYASTDNILTSFIDNDNNENTVYDDVDVVNKDINNASNKICSQCRNIINKQSTEHRKTLISKRLTLANDIIVNRVDTHYLNLHTYNNKLNYQEPYTPESIESHSPAPDIIDLEVDELQNDVDDGDDNNEPAHDLTNNRLEQINNEINTEDSRNFNNNINKDLVYDNECFQLQQNKKKLSGGGVSPRQLKSRLEHLHNKSSPFLKRQQRQQQIQQQEEQHPLQFPLNHNVINGVGVNDDNVKNGRKINCCKTYCNIL